jgi:hypothetical protein
MDFQLLPFASILDDGKKRTRKRQQLEMLDGQFFPAEGHAAVLMERNDSTMCLITLGMHALKIIIV